MKMFTFYKANCCYYVLVTKMLYSKTKIRSVRGLELILCDRVEFSVWICKKVPPGIFCQHFLFEAYIKGYKGL